jgi:hypothetical protein
MDTAKTRHCDREAQPKREAIQPLQPIDQSGLLRQLRLLAMTKAGVSGGAPIHSALAAHGHRQKRVIATARRSRSGKQSSRRAPSIDLDCFVGLAASQ